MQSSDLLKRLGAIPYSIRSFNPSSKVKGRGVAGAEKFLDTAYQSQQLIFNGVPASGQVVLSFQDEETVPVTIPGDLSDPDNLYAFQQALQTALCNLEDIGYHGPMSDEPNLDLDREIVTTYGGVPRVMMTFTFNQTLGPLSKILVVSTTATPNGGIFANIIFRPGVAVNTRAQILASVQTATPYQMAILPEGERTSQGLVIYTTYHLRAAVEQQGTKGDRLIQTDDDVKGYAEFEVKKVDTYPNETHLPHFRALAVLVERDTN